MTAPSLTPPDEAPSPEPRVEPSAVAPAVEAPEAPPTTPDGAARGTFRTRRDVISYLDWPATGASRGTIILLHGLQSTALTMARIGERLAANGWRVIVPDLPGHGHTFALDGSDAERPGGFDASRLTILRLRLSRRHRLRATARVVAQLASELSLTDVAVLGHSWGASIAAVLPSVGLVPAVTILLDPPFVTAAEARRLGIAAMANPTPSYEEARDSLLTSAREWHPLDLAAKAEAVTRVSTSTMVAIVAGNVPFDPIPALRRTMGRRSGANVYVITGVPDHGSFVTPAGLAELRRLLGDDHVIVMDAGHSPHRTHHDEFMGLVERILQGGAGASSP
jgi:pimeloyl-ACP methyl ester carboxylesterase